MTQRGKGQQGMSAASQGGGGSHQTPHHPSGAQPHGKGRQPSTTHARMSDEQFLHKFGGQLSKTTQNSIWIRSPQEHEERPGESLGTRSHEVIQQWAEERGGQPATVPGTEHEGRPGVLRFNFPGYGGQGLQPISWEEWFRTFDERDLVFLFQEHKSNGDMSNFFRLDSPHREEA
ncbi:MAG TPA: hypothetical protein VHS06_00575 [Chloroflexota bacterium]|nr:hypothetical protein [Chloroflexota bacterium]